MSFVPLLLYINIVDFREVYNLDDFKTWQAILIVAITSVIAVVIPLVIMFRSTIVNREVPPELISDDDTQRVVVIPDGVPIPS